MKAELERAKAWLAAPQLKKAVLIHHGDTLPAKLGGRAVTIVAAPDHIRVECNGWRIIEPEQNCDACGHHRPAVREEKTFNVKERRAIRTAVAAVFPIADSWSGPTFVSFTVKTPTHPTLRAALRRYLDGCPDCGGSVFCGTANHEWRQGFDLLRPLEKNSG